MTKYHWLYIVVCFVRVLLVKTRIVRPCPNQGGRGVSTKTQGRAAFCFLVNDTRTIKSPPKVTLHDGIDANSGYGVAWCVSVYLC